MDEFYFLLYSSLLSLIIATFSKLISARIEKFKDSKSFNKFIGFFIYIFFIIFLFSLIILIYNTQSNVDSSIPMGIDKELRNIQAAWNNRGYALYKEGSYEDAIKCYDNAIELDPNYSLAWGNKAEALKKLGRNTEANAAFAKAKKLGYTG